jgi:deoxyuridine 5'-triphosphate nucleotidohydrolase
VLRILVHDDELYSREVHEGFGPSRRNDAGVDLRARYDTRVFVGKTVAIPLGVAIEIPEDTVGWITGRSSTQLKMGLFVHEGKIDSGYRGEVHCVVTASEAAVDLERGDRICSLVVLRIVQPEKMDADGERVARWQVVERLGHSSRGDAKFGSTGKR